MKTLNEHISYEHDSASNLSVRIYSEACDENSKKNFRAFTQGMNIFLNEATTYDFKTASRRQLGQSIFIREARFKGTPLAFVLNLVFTANPTLLK